MAITSNTFVGWKDKISENNETNVFPIIFKCKWNIRYIYNNQISRINILFSKSRYQLFAVKVLCSDLT